MAMILPPIGHNAGRLLGSQQERLGLRVERHVPLLRRDLQWPLVEPRQVRPRVVHEDVQPAERALDLVEHSADVLGTRNVGLTKTMQHTASGHGPVPAGDPGIKDGRRLTTSSMPCNASDAAMRNPPRAPNCRQCRARPTDDDVTAAAAPGSGPCPPELSVPAVRRRRSPPPRSSARPPCTGDCEPTLTCHFRRPIDVAGLDKKRCPVARLLSIRVRTNQPPGTLARCTSQSWCSQLWFSRFDSSFCHTFSRESSDFDIISLSTLFTDYKCGICLCHSDSNPGLTPAASRSMSG